jgi:glutamate dehydrogenase (NADP+)
MEENEIAPDVQEKLMQPKMALQFGIPVQMDNGGLKVFTGYRIQYNDTRGPFKGGIRFHPKVNYDEVASLSLWMTIKCAIAGIPYGGGKGGVTANPKEMSESEIERLSRGYVRALADNIGQEKDIPAPDVNTNGKIMAWMVEEFETIKRRKEPGVFTGKPVSLGGSKGREQATGEGGLYALNLWVDTNNLTPQDLTVAIQGFGNVGYHFARLARECKYKIVAVSDSKGAIYSESGFDPIKLQEFKSQRKSFYEIFADNESVKKITNEELLELNVDVLVPAALENQITKENADNIKAKHILELANGPVALEAEAVLDKKNINVIPDVLANAGGVAVSYFEWIQNKTGYYWDENEVSEKLKKLIEQEAGEIYLSAKENGISLRKAAYRLALKRIEKAYLDKKAK